ncbi:alpha/beta hydrolase family protein [Nocardioides marmorisolisilvae]|uniref:Alpha/beta hydrolase n=1 Tax=Nocardioides marmorisolisilvae TaxID=1542737 RepID=A0A3N0E0D4_9ACTN|nr:prolyl oligopeptidase family serine peptidase [Nocardioides marmorisolisilvae]RNL81308.1 alpha/beta hydrolase [Nocardioides marmorisolisilvae]
MTDLLPDAVVRYGDHELAVIDLHVPVEANGTLVVLVHGGFWKQQFDRTHTREQARALADAGYLVATPEYRRVGGGGGWPTTALDVEAAVNALPVLIAGLGLTFERAALTGHSAGGHLVTWLLTRALAVDFDRVVPVAGVVDLVLADERHLGSDAVLRFLDGAPVTEADPMTLLTAAPNAVVQLLHGADDDTVPIELSRRFVAAHPWAELVELPGVGHFEFLDPADPAFDALLELLRR